MDNSIYVALSKQSAGDMQMDMIANNIANANTPGYKAQSVAFSSYLQKTGGNTTSYAKVAGAIRDDSQGTLQTTGNPLDLAIQGNGYFEVQTPQGNQYTRAGNFMVDANGYLVTSSGNQVLDKNGQGIQFQPQDQVVKVYSDGRLEVDGSDRAYVGVYNINNPTPVGNNLYSSSQAGTSIAIPSVAQGMLENSNVNSIMEMTKMISVQRDYERTANYISSMYDLQNTAITTIAKTGS